MSVIDEYGSACAVCLPRCAGMGASCIHENYTAGRSNAIDSFASDQIVS